MAIGGKVVRVAIAACHIMGDHNIRFDASDQGNQAPPCLGRVGLVEAAGIRILRRTDHTRIAEPEEAHIGEAERLRRRQQLLGTNLRQRLGRRQAWVADLTSLSTGHTDQRHVCARRRIARQCTAGRKLIIWVSKYRKDCPRLHSTPPHIRTLECYSLYGERSCVKRGRWTMRDDWWLIAGSWSFLPKLIS